MTTIQIDVDGVLADFTRGFYDLAHYHFGVPKRCQREHTTGELTGLTDDQRDVIWREIARSPRFWARLDGLVTYPEMRRLNDARHMYETYFVTTRRIGPECHTQTVDWLQGQGVTTPRVILAAKGGKGMIAKGLGANFALDDSVEHLEDIRCDSPGTIRCIRSWAYNHTLTDDVGRHVSSLTEFCDVVGIPR